MIEMNVNKLSKYFGATMVFENMTLEVQTKERIGLIGKNGCGKTTLMKVIMGEEDYQSGEIAFRKGLSKGYLNQIPVYPTNMSVETVIRQAYDHLNSLRDKMNQYEQLFLEPELSESAMENALKEYGKVSHQFEEKGGYEIDTKVAQICEGLKIDNSMRNQLFELLSGGEKTRVQLAKILCDSPDLLLLDEPSNHLDIESIEWLEEYLKDYQGSVVIISHDRYFLDRVVTKVVEMETDGTEIYEGNYSYYSLEKERRFLLAMKYYEEQQKKINRMEEQIKRYRIWGEMRDSEKMYKKAKELEKRLAKVSVLDRPVFEHKKIKLLNDGVSRSSNSVLNIEGLDIGYSEVALLKNAEMVISYQDSYCIVGKNGSGKTSLLKVILSEIANKFAEDGLDFAKVFHDKLGELNYRCDIRVGKRLNIGYLPQEIIFEEPNQTILEYFQSQHNIPQGEARRELAKVLFGQEQVQKSIGTLSGGEKSRLRLCSLMYNKVNFLILDEPTNHLDIDSREVLETLLEDFEGTILMVSHDRYFISKVATIIGEIEDKKIVVYPFGYEDYRETKSKQQQKLITIKEDNKKSGVISSKQIHADVTKKTKETKKTMNESKYLFEKAKLDNEIKAVEHALSSTRYEMEQHLTDAQVLIRVVKDVEKLEEKLLDLYEKLEQLEASK